MKAGQGFVAEVSGTTHGNNEARGRYLWEKLFLMNVFELTETKRFEEDPLWGCFLERLRLGMCTKRDLEHLNTRLLSKMTSVESARFALSPLLSSFNRDLVAYGNNTCEAIAATRKELVYTWNHPDHVMNVSAGKGANGRTVDKTTRDVLPISANHRPLLYRLLSTHRSFTSSNVSDTGKRLRKGVFFKGIRGVITENDQTYKGTV